MRKSIRNVMGILTAVLLAGCSQSSSILKSQMYLGPELPKNQIAVITGSRSSESHFYLIVSSEITSFAMIHMVDGQVVEIKDQNGIPIKEAYDAREVHVLPGFHEVVVRVNVEMRGLALYVGSCYTCTRLLTFNFEAEAGHTYIVVEPRIRRREIVRTACNPQVIHIIDEATRKIVVSKEVDSFTVVECD